MRGLDGCRSIVPRRLDKSAPFSSANTRTTSVFHFHRKFEHWLCWNWFPKRWIFKRWILAFVSPGLRDSQVCEISNTKIKREETEERKGVSLSFSRHRPFFSDHEYIFACFLLNTRHSLIHSHPRLVSMCPVNLWCLIDIAKCFLGHFTYCCSRLGLCYAVLFWGGSGSIPRKFELKLRRH